MAQVIKVKPNANASGMVQAVGFKPQRFQKVITLHVKK